MTDILTAADLAELRGPRWVRDAYDDRTSIWGASGSAVLAAPALVGATSLSVSGLKAGTIVAGTPFTLVSAYVPYDYVVAADVTIAAGAATITLTTALKAAGTAGDHLTPRPLVIGAYAEVFGADRGPMFLDSDLQSFARSAEERWGPMIHESLNPREMRFRAISYLATEAQMYDSRYEAAVQSFGWQDGGTAHFARLEARAKAFLADVGFKTFGFSHGTLTR